jgi:hypothetical protein
LREWLKVFEAVILLVKSEAQMQCHRKDRAASYELPGEDESKKVATAILVKVGLPLVSNVAPCRRAVAHYNKREGRASVSSYIAAYATLRELPSTYSPIG